MRIFILGLTALALCACSPRVEADRCGSGESERAVATLYFGRNTGDRLGVTEAAWDRFVELQITSRFPEGLTVDDVEGQWRDTDNGQIVHEPSKAVTIIMGEDVEAARKLIDEITAAYKRQFRQQAVGVVVERSCVSF